jgi:ElaB/YqjD/DUF883 family membrane-anchored ribosome-binding protein
MTTANQQSAEGLAAAAARIAAELQRARDDIARSAASAGDDLAAELHRLQDDLAAIQQTVAGFGKQTGAEASGAAPRIGAAAADAARDFADNARQDASSALADFEEFCRKNPRCVLGGALALGFILGLMLRRR